MAAVIVTSIGTAPAGAITKFAATIGALTAIAGAQNTTPGRYLLKNANGLSGGVPNAGAQVFVLFTPTVWLNPAFGPTKYSPAAGAVNGVIGDWMMGAYNRRLRQGAWIISTSGTPAVVLSPCLVFVST